MAEKALLSTYILSGRDPVGRAIRFTSFTTLCRVRFYPSRKLNGAIVHKSPYQLFSSHNKH